MPDVRITDGDKILRFTDENRLPVEAIINATFEDAKMKVSPDGTNYLPLKGDSEGNIAKETEIKTVLDEAKQLLADIKSVMDMSRKGASTETKPTTGVTKYTTYWEIDTGNMYYYNGTSWVVMS